MKKILIFSVWFGLLVPASLPSMQNLEKLYLRARKDIAREKWEKADEKLTQLLKRSGEHPYRDDAIFWRGYILEAKGRLLDAFQQFSRLATEYPTSPLADNARAHQIRIAQRLYWRGRKPFKNFIERMVQHEDGRIRHEAALSLVELGDSAYVDLVRTLADADDPWLQKRARRALRVLQKKPKQESTAVDLSQQRTVLQFDVDTDKKPDQPQKKSWREDFLFYKTQRYRLYETLYRRYYANDSTWTLEELIDYGLFHIVPPDQFEQYLALRDPYDRQEWLRMFWKANDPTPTTEKNEFQEEFVRRVLKARAKYGEEWNARHLRYLRNQYMRRGWSWSPWDSRGELLIKLGEPDLEEIIDLNVDIWYYGREGVSFGVNRYVNNLYGNGYYPDGVYAYQHVGGPMGIEVDYIYRNKFFYYPFPGVRKIKGVTFTVKAGSGRLDIRYAFPANKLAIAKPEQGDGTGYLRRLVIFNEDYIEVYRSEKTFRVAGASGRQSCSERFEIDLPPGRYRVALRLQDLHAERMTILKKEVELKKD